MLQKQILILNCQVLTKWVEKSKNIWFKLFFRKNSFWRRCYTNLFSISAKNRYFKTIAGVGNGNYIYYWQSKGLSDKKINSIKTPNHGITPNLSHYGTRARVEFSGSCLEQDKVTFNHGKAVKIYIVYEIIKSNNTTDYPTLENCLFGAVYFN